MVVLGVAATILIVIRILWSATRAARHEYKKRKLKRERKGLDEQKKVIELNPTRMKGAKSAMFDGHSPVTSKASSKALASKEKRGSVTLEAPKQFENPSFRRFSSTNSTKSSGNNNDNNSPGSQTMVATRGAASSFCLDSPSGASLNGGSPGSVGSRGSVCLDKNWLDSVGNSPASQGSPSPLHARGSRGDSGASVCLDNAWLDSVGGVGDGSGSPGVRKSYSRRSTGRKRLGR